MNAASLGDFVTGQVEADLVPRLVQHRVGLLASAEFFIEQAIANSRRDLGPTGCTRHGAWTREHAWASYGGPLIMRGSPR